VIVATSRIERHGGRARIAQALPFDRLPPVTPLARQVIHARRDHAHGARHQLGGPRALHAVARHVVHRAVKAGVEPRAQTGLGRGQVDAGNTDL
jgi:hypothetical protein